MKKFFEAVIGVVIVAGAMYFIYKVGPPYFNNYRFADDINQLAMAESYTPHDEQMIRDKVIRTGTENSVDLTPQNVVVTRNQSQVTIVVDYTVHIDIPVHPFDMHFHCASSNTAM